MMTNAKEQQKQKNTFEIIKLMYDNLDDMYDIYIKNHAYRDENFVGEHEERLILNDDSTYTYEQFREVCKDKRTAVFGINEVVPFTDYDILNEKKPNDPIMLNILRGYIIYEVLIENNHKIYSILFLEHDSNYREEVYQGIISFMKGKLIGESKIRIEIEDSDVGYKIIKELMKNGFKQKKLVTSEKKSDVFIFEYSL